MPQFSPRGALPRVRDFLLSLLLEETHPEVAGAVRAQGNMSRDMASNVQRSVKPTLSR
jgi:hypothetical protein